MTQVTLKTIEQNDNVGMFSISYHAHTKRMKSSVDMSWIYRLLTKFCSKPKRMASLPLKRI